MASKSLQTWRDPRHGAAAAFAELEHAHRAVGHGDVDARLACAGLRPPTVTLAACRGWRSALNVLASSLDRTAADQCVALGLTRPW